VITDIEEDVMLALLVTTEIDEEVEKEDEIERPELRVLDVWLKDKETEIPETLADVVLILETLVRELKTTVVL